MCPPDAGKKPRKPYRTRGRATVENFKVMRWLDEERQRQGISLRDVARQLGYQNATRVREYFDQRIVAGRTILQKLAIAVKVSPIDALWNARHYDAVLDILQKLYQLGWSWMHEDNVWFAPDAGVTFWGPNYDNDGERDMREPPPDLAARYIVATVSNFGGICKVVTVPKPIACAILLALHLFPRRGDSLRPEADALYGDLSLLASAMLPQAELARIPRQNIVAMWRPLKAALDVLKYRFYGPMRLAIVGEYVHAWSDFICRPYADYARVALYSQGGFVGKPGESENLWEWQRADLPTVKNLRIQTNRQ